MSSGWRECLPTILIKNTLHLRTNLREPPKGSVTDAGF